MNGQIRMCFLLHRLSISSVRNEVDNREIMNKKNMHWPGIGPGSPAWQASILPLNHQCLRFNGPRSVVTNPSAVLCKFKRKKRSATITSLRVSQSARAWREEIIDWMKWKRTCSRVVSVKVLPSRFSDRDWFIDEKKTMTLFRDELFESSCGDWEEWMISGEKKMHWPGIGPGSPAWQASILPLNHQCLLSYAVNLLLMIIHYSMFALIGKKGLFDISEKTTSIRGNAVIHSMYWFECYYSLVGILRREIDALLGIDEKHIAL